MDILQILGKIGFDTRIFLFNLINFIIIAALLQKFFFGKMMRTIEERQRIINEGIENSEAAKSELAMANQKGEEIIKQAKGEAGGILKQAADNAKQLEIRLKQEAESEIAEMRQKSEQQLQQERTQMFNDFKQDASELVILATEKLLAQKSEESESADVEKLIKSMGLRK